MKKLLLIFAFFISSFFVEGQIKTWAVAVGGYPIEEGFSIAEAKYGGYFITGTQYVIEPQYNNMYVAKVDSLGNFEWGKTIGGYRYHGGNSYGNSVAPAYDGGCVALGTTALYGQGNGDVYIVRLDSTGNVKWTKTIGGKGEDYGYSIAAANDYGYIITGSTNSFGVRDIYLIKLDSSGSLQWTKTIGGGSGSSVGHCVIQTKDKGYTITGYTSSYGAGKGDVYVVKLDSTGSLQWTRTIGGKNDDWGSSIIQSKDGGYAVTGVTYSFFDTLHGDVYIIKLDSVGNLKWTRTTGDTSSNLAVAPGSDAGQSIVQAANGDFVVAGYTGSFGVTCAFCTQAYFIQLDSLGNITKTHTYGGGQATYCEAIIKTKDGGYTMAGYTSDFRGWMPDVYLWHLDSLGNNCDTTGSGQRIDSGGIVSNGGIVTTMDSGYVGSGGAITSHGMITGSCGVPSSIAKYISSSINIEIFPNPCSNTLIIDLENQPKLSSFQITDITGRVLFTDHCQLRTGHYSIGVSELASGMYFLFLNSPTSTSVKKFIKE